MAYDISESIRECIAKRREAKELEDRAKELKDEANTLLQVYKDSGDIAEDTVAVEGVGKITFTTATRTTTDVRKFKENLVLAGVAVGKIAEAEAASTSTSTSSSIRFTAAK